MSMDAYPRESCMFISSVDDNYNCFACIRKSRSYMRNDTVIIDIDFDFEVDQSKLTKKP